MTQQHGEHLTNEQLSAFFDKQLSPQQQAVFDAHLSTCQQCQRNLAGLRLTVALLHALPQEEVPRSFILPAGLAPVPEHPVRQAEVMPIATRRRSPWQHAVRVVSTIAAVLALLFIISGILPPLHFGAGSSTTATSSSSGESNTSNTTMAPHVGGTPIPGQAQQGANTTPTPTKTHSLTPTATPGTGSDFSTNQAPAVPPLFDLGQPLGRLFTGALLLVLSIIGLIFTRGRRGAVY